MHGVETENRNHERGTILLWMLSVVGVCLAVVGLRSIVGQLWPAKLGGAEIVSAGGGAEPGERSFGRNDLFKCFFFLRVPGQAGLISEHTKVRCFQMR